MIWLTKNAYWLVLFASRKTRHKMMFLRKHADVLGYKYAEEFYNKTYDKNS